MTASSKFSNNFITKGAKGGEEAADALLAALQQYVRGLVGEPTGMDILVRAFANVSGLGAVLERTGKLNEASQLRAFATGFSSRQAFFEFVDIGSGKERADFKVRGESPPVVALFPLPYHHHVLIPGVFAAEGIKFFLESSQCRHLVLACGHDSGYARFWGSLWETSRWRNASRC